MHGTLIKRKASHMVALSSASLLVRRGAAPLLARTMVPPAAPAFMMASADEDASSFNVSAIPAASLAFYVWFFFLSPYPPGPNALEMDSAAFLRTALDLSQNFFFILPIVYPDASTVNDPCYEAIFNFAIAHSLLFAGFIADGRRSAEDGALGRNRFLPFLAAMPFATNIAYLAYLSIRDVKQIGDAAENDAIIVAPNILERAAESRWLPVVLTAASPELRMGRRGTRRGVRPTLERLQVLASLLNSDERLAYALLGDVVFFSAFQGWLVEDDLARREPPRTAAPHSAPLHAACHSLGSRTIFMRAQNYSRSEPSLCSHADRATRRGKSIEVAIV